MFSIRKNLCHLQIDRNDCIVFSPYSIRVLVASFVAANECESTQLSRDQFAIIDGSSSRYVCLRPFADNHPPVRIYSFNVSGD